MLKFTKNISTFIAVFLLLEQNKISIESRSATIVV